MYSFSECYIKIEIARWVWLTTGLPDVLALCMLMLFCINLAPIVILHLGALDQGIILCCYILALNTIWRSSYGATRIKLSEQVFLGSTDSFSEKKFNYNLKCFINDYEWLARKKETLKAQELVQGLVTICYSNSYFSGQVSSTGLDL